MKHGPRLRVAIVGSGMAGLVTAFLLNRDRQGRFDVRVFEAVRPRLESSPGSRIDIL